MSFKFTSAPRQSPSPGFTKMNPSEAVQLSEYEAFSLYPHVSSAVFSAVAIALQSTSKLAARASTPPPAFRHSIRPKPGVEVCVDVGVEVGVVVGDVVVVVVSEVVGDDVGDVVGEVRIQSPNVPSKSLTYASKTSLTVSHGPVVVHESPVPT